MLDYNNIEVMCLQLITLGAVSVDNTIAVDWLVDRPLCAWPVLTMLRQALAARGHCLAVQNSCLDARGTCIFNSQTDDVQFL